MYSLCIGGTEPGGKCGVGQLVMAPLAAGHSLTQRSLVLIFDGALFFG